MFDPSLMSRYKSRLFNVQVQVEAFALLNVTVHDLKPVKTLNFELSKSTRLMHLTLKCTKFSNFSKFTK